MVSRWLRIRDPTTGAFLSSFTFRRRPLVRRLERPGTNTFPTPCVQAPRDKRLHSVYRCRMERPVCSGRGVGGASYTARCE
jgi:hypothetical protein